MIFPKDPSIYKTYAYRRYTAGVYINGRYEAGSYTETAFVASIQPLSPDQLLRMTGNDRIKKGISIWTDTALSIGSVGDSSEALVKPDEVIFKDERYAVDRLDVWDCGMAHYKGYALLVNDDS